MEPFPYLCKNIFDWYFTQQAAIRVLYVRIVVKLTKQIMEEKINEIEDSNENEDFVLNFGDIIIPEPETQPTLPCDFKDRNHHISPRDEKNIEVILEETCYHEASHYVMGVIMAKMPNFCFKFPKSIIVDVREGKRFLAQMERAYVYDSKGKELYNADYADKETMLIQVLNLASGYTSYLIFTNAIIKNFITSPNFEYKNEALSSVVKYTAKYIKDFYKSGHDIYKIKKFLSLIFYYKGAEGLNSETTLESIIDELARFMCLHLKEPIQYVADFLRENNGKKIEGEELGMLQNKVSEMTKDVNLNELAEIIWKKIDEVVDEHKKRLNSPRK